MQCKRIVSKNSLYNKTWRSKIRRVGSVCAEILPSNIPAKSLEWDWDSWISALLYFGSWIRDFRKMEFGPNTNTTVLCPGASPAFPSITICPVFWPHPFFCWGKSGRRSQLLVDKTNCAHTSKKNTATIERKKGNRVDTLEICHDISASDVCPASGTTNLPPRYTAHTTSQNPHEKPNHWCLLTFWSSRITFDAGATFNLPNKINSNSLHPTANHEIRRKISGQLSWA